VKYTWGRLRKWFVRTFWATHNDSPVVRRVLAPLLAAPGMRRGLNLGCGQTRFDQRILNFDLTSDGAAQVIGDALRLPFANRSFDLVISQEAVEHISDPFWAVREMARVLRPGGKLYLQAPFIIGYHPGPEDYWRFTHAGLRQLLEKSGLQCQTIDRAVGSGTALYRIMAEFWAVLAASCWQPLYFPVKALGAVAFYPLKWMDALTISGAQSDRIPGGYFAIGIVRDA
jgi:SAM-dependent methyltransferase